MRSNANVELRIEELVLHDLPYDQRHRVAAAIEQELTRLLAERGVPPGLDEDRAPIDLGPVRVNPNQAAESIGMQVAGSIYGELAAGASTRGAAASQMKGRHS